MEEIDKCFIIMPFRETSPSHTEDYWKRHFELFLKPFIQDRGHIIVERSERMRTDLLHEIIKNLILSRIVIADITNLNPNVLWELGVRQSFKYKTIIIAEEGTEKPFDISKKGILEYPKKDDSDYHNKSIKFHLDLVEAIQDCKINPDKPDSPVLEIIEGRSSIFPLIQKQENLRKIEAFLIEIEYNKTVLNRIMQYIQENKWKIFQIYPTSRLKLQSCNLLLTNRYLYEDETFYQRIHEFSAEFERINSELNTWAIQGNQAIFYLKKNVPKLQEEINDLVLLIEEAKKKLSSVI